MDTQKQGALEIAEGSVSSFESRFQPSKQLLRFRKKDVTDNVGKEVFLDIFVPPE